MSDYPIANSRGGRHRPTGPPRHRTYVFAVTALSAFVLVLALLREFGASYVATATIVPVRSVAIQRAAGPDSIAVLEELLTSSETLRAALANNVAADEFDGSDVRRRLTVSRDHGPGDETVVKVSLVEGNRQRSIESVNAIVREAVSRTTAPRGAAEADPEALSATQAAATARRELESARRQRDEFVAAHRDRLNQLTREPVAAPPVATVPRQAAAVREDSPARQRLEQLTLDWQKLRDQQGMLLARMTEGHPHYQVVHEQTREIERQLAEARQAVADEAAAAVMTATVEPSRPAVDAAAQHERQQLLAELAQAKRGAADAQVRFDRAARVADAALQAAQARVQIRLEPAWHVEPAVAALPMRQRTSLPVVLLAAAIGVVVGSATLLYGGAMRTVVRGADVAELLHVPLLGTLADQGERVTPRSRSADRAARAILIGSELVLALFLVAMLAAALTDRTFAGQLASDPLGGLADGVHRMISVVSGRIA